MSSESPDSSELVSNPKEVQERVILVDTNCFIRLYQSPVLPFLGKKVEGYHLLTLPLLIDEFLNSRNLQIKYAWLKKTVESEDLKTAGFHVPADDQESIDEIADLHEDYCNDVLYDYCQKEEIEIRELSPDDCQLLATAIHFRTLIASDEWPLAYAVKDLMDAPAEDEYCIGILTSIDILFLLEKAGLLNKQERIDTIKGWLRNDEKLHREWRKTYRSLFNEGAPTL